MVRGRSNYNNISNGMIPLMLFQAVNEYRRLDRKPPVTAALLAANTLIYLRPGVLHDVIPPIHDVFFNAHLIVKKAIHTPRARYAIPTYLTDKLPGLLLLVCD
ncbi:rhomboid protein [Artemisia annua]|uniref:Rhomboid protein n=1 Tax=Artemisia annua TaxID=35608 RepID=A0A2U1KE12_ARTAN|nr:rhomboid protein [Artemisia annua]